MKASQVADYLRNLIEEYGDLELVYSIDDEGNDFKKFIIMPALEIMMKKIENFISPRISQIPFVLIKLAVQPILYGAK